MVLWLAVLLVAPLVRARDYFSTRHIQSLREEVREMFTHAWTSYEQHAFPQDALAPLSCIGVGPDYSDPLNTPRNDVLGDYGLTLIDTLDSFVLFNDTKGFAHALDMVRRYVDFDVATTVQVFETTIRTLGGLLSAHAYASQPALNFAVPGYDGFLLDLAVDLADRLMPAFDTPSGIPHPRINLRSGIGLPQLSKTCASGAALIVEFGVLSNYTGDPQYIDRAKSVFLDLWEKRSSLDLIGSSIDTVTGQWTYELTGVGANTDSFYEYALKYYILFDDPQFLDIFNTGLAALFKHSWNGLFFDNVHYRTGHKMVHWMDSLSAFFPGLLVLAGDIPNAVKNHLIFYKIWQAYGALPERWNQYRHQVSVNLPFYILRPEFIESTYFLFQATKDSFYLYVGEQIVRDLQQLMRVPCGFASLADVVSGRLEDKMESFFLSETLKYLYLLFDIDNPINHIDSNFVFSTEAHPLFLFRNSTVPTRTDTAGSPNWTPRFAVLIRYELGTVLHARLHIHVP
ncbi:glycoside hydrolase family 47 protein [Tortispora caseinolytica NRRL Y-17796]|uniref:alpha-1,2-Mannosidase n=1 Tax=Tortispora caseinolytica NRRL Y-17796 TaxID=767744 RepID=A0A1E4TLJ1_9ASCO|nr:glycoside hydrolase family 47 protein [Tortispora caseinolytica NRRL Y-17796]